MTLPPDAAICRLGRQGYPDDVVIAGTLFRMERMTDTQWWIGVYRGTQRCTFVITSATPIQLVVWEDELGLTNDTTAD